MGNTQTTLQVAVHNAKRGNFELLQSTINQKDKFGNTTLHYAARKHSPENLKVIQFLIENGADLNIRNPKLYTPLMLSAKCFCPDILEYLINTKKSSKVMEGLEVVTAKYVDGRLAKFHNMSFLHWLIVRHATPEQLENKLKCLKLIIDNGARCNLACAIHRNDNIEPMSYNALSLAELFIKSNSLNH